MTTIQLTVSQVGGKPCLIAGDEVHTTYKRFREIKPILQACGISSKVSKRHIELMDEWRNDPKTDRNNHKAYTAAYAKLYNRAVFEETHVNQSQFIKLFNGKMYEAFIKPIPEQLFTKFCFGSYGKPSMQKVNEMNGCLHIILEAQSDNNTHLIPLIMKFQKSPQELRRMFGKGVWKRICKNTVSRNAAIAEWLFKRMAYNRDFDESVVDKMKNILDVPTTLLAYSYPSVVLRYLAKHKRGEWSKKNKLRPVVDLLGDTIQMANLYGYATPDILKWSERRLREEHERFTKIAYARKYSDVEFDWASKLPFGEFCFGEYTVHPLLNAMDIGQEGLNMHHCVGSYVLQSQYGTYLVLSVRKGGERYSTIGMYMAISKQDEFTLQFQQQYMQYNQALPMDDKARDIPDFICSLVSAPIRGKSYNLDEL